MTLSYNQYDGVSRRVFPETAEGEEDDPQVPGNAAAEARLILANNNVNIRILEA